MREIEDYRRKFLVVVDEGEDCAKAAAFAAYRVRRTGGTVVLLAIIDSGDFQQFLGVGEVMRAEATEAAEALLARHAARLRKIGDIQIETVIREGLGAEAVEGLIAEDKDIAILVLTGGSSGEGADDLITAFASRAGGNALHIPMTIVPGSMTEAEIEAVS